MENYFNYNLLQLYTIIIRSSILEYSSGFVLPLPLSSGYYDLHNSDNSVEKHKNNIMLL